MNISIGEEIATWAENYWNIDKLSFIKEVNLDDEKFEYGRFRKALISKINSEIENRLFPKNEQNKIISNFY